MSNIILQTDSYKVSHWKQMPPNTATQFSYFESRGGLYDKTLFFGLQYIIKKHLSGRVVTQEKIDAAEKVFAKHFGHSSFFNRAGWEYILNTHGGYLPVAIRAVPEGTFVPTKNLLFSVWNTDPKCAWLTSYIEIILVRAWYPIAVATYSAEARSIIRYYMDKTEGVDYPVDFQLHDFGYRGATCDESAAIGASAHLLNFKGTDTLAAFSLLEDFYECSDVPGYSIPAAEHSTITSWGKDNEAQAYRNMLEQFPNGLVAVVSDSYDIYNACSEIWGTELRNHVLERNGVLVIRPDSGDALSVVPTLLDILGSKFGFYKNEKGFKKLNDKVRLIWGDGISNHTMEGILDVIMRKGWSAANIAFGSGSKLLQEHKRDDLRMAMKCSAVITTDGTVVDVYKDPITDKGKSSKRGILDLYKIGDSYETRTLKDVLPDELSNQPNRATYLVFKNGFFVSEDTFMTIRERRMSQNDYPTRMENQA